MSAHAKLSPSSAHRWLNCPGSAQREKDFPNTRSEFSDEGSAAHFLAAYCLKRNEAPAQYLGHEIAVDDIDEYWADKNKFLLSVIGDEAALFTVTDEMVDNVSKYIDVVTTYACGHTVIVEERVPIDHLTGEQDAKGTADALILTDDEIILIDLKYGRGVPVYADFNEQLMMYALGALELYGALGNFERVRLVIHQPRLGNLSEWSCTIDELQDFAAAIKATIPKTKDANALNPGEDQCRFCKAKATCPALTRDITEATAADFYDVSQTTLPVPVSLSAAMAKVELIEGWCKAVRAETERALLDGKHVAGWKLVEGRKGARSWSSEEEAEAAMKSMRLKTDEMYSFKIISPTQAEKLLKESPRRWNKLLPLITQRDGGPSVAPESDKRPALVMAAKADEFDVVQFV